MAIINEHYLKLQAGYLFPEIRKRVTDFAQKNPDKKIIKLGIGDVTLPLPRAVTDAMHKAIDELGTSEGFKGYGPSEGYEFLREKIQKFDYTSRGVHIDLDEIFTSDGSKCDSANIQEIFDIDSTIAITDPVYPVYLDTNVMAGRTGNPGSDGKYEGIIYLPCNRENNFNPPFPEKKADIIYLCFPNNPTGTAASKEILESWVSYARDTKSIILFDGAYEAFITEPGIPHSIYEIDGAKKVAIEFRSFSKNAGFTGTRAAYTVVPKELFAFDKKGNEISLHKLWTRRHNTKFNGLSYPVQRGAEAVYSDEGRAQVKELVGYYMRNARIIAKCLSDLGIEFWGGKNAPYLWLRTYHKYFSQNELTSWDFFDKLLNEAYVVGTPGSGFGPSGEGYFRLSAFGSRENVTEAMERIKKLINNEKP